jgi:3-(3-hydroxy-phenyl)propionate hydroxylase
LTKRREGQPDHIRNRNMTRIQVTVVGAGPVGTFAAYYLAQKGIDVVALEAASSCEEDMRASTFHSPTIEMLDQLGIAERLISEGLKAPVYQYRIRSTGEVLQFDLTELEDELEFPFRLQCEQYKMARMLANGLNQHPHSEIHFNNRVVSFEQKADCVIVSAQSENGLVDYRTDYVIAADGANSLIRKKLGVEFSGFTYPEKFLTLSTDVPMEQYFHDVCYVNYVSDPDQWFVLLRVPTSWRILVPVNRDDDDEYILSDEKTNSIFDSLIGNGDTITTHHRTIYRVHQRVANKFHHGRILLVGDAAHLNNPLGGFGMNSGIHDAWNLCGKLVAILHDKADHKKFLDQFDRQRRAVTNGFIQSQTIRNKRMMEESAELALQHEWEKMRRINANSHLRRDFMRRQSMVQSLKDEAMIA